MSERRHVPEALAELMAAPVIPGASCHGLAPEWDGSIPGEGAGARWPRLMAARQTCRRCPGLPRCLERLEELDSDVVDVVLAGEVIDHAGRVLAPRWHLADALRSSSDTQEDPMPEQPTGRLRGSYGGGPTEDVDGAPLGVIAPTRFDAAVTTGPADPDAVPWSRRLELDHSEQLDGDALETWIDQDDDEEDRPR